MSKGRIFLTIILFTLGWTVMYADRNVLGPVMSTVAIDWGLSKSQLGLMSTVFFVAYAGMQIPGGFLADRFGRVKVLVTGFILFAIGCLFSGLVPGLMTFLIVRFIAGFGESSYYGSQYAISSNVIPAKYRGFSSAIINSGMALGVSLGFILSSYMTFDLQKDWQTPFIILGIPSFIIAILIAIFVKDQSAEDTGAAANIEVAKPSLKVLFSRNHILTYILIFTSLYGFYGMLTWLPYYLETVRGLEASQTGIISSLIPWASIPGALFFGWLSDRLKSKKTLIICLAFGSAFCQFMIPYVESYSLMIVGLILYGLIGRLALDPVLVAYIGGITPRSVYSKAFSFLNFAGMLSTVFAPTVAGYLADATGHLESAFYLSGGLILIGGIVFIFTKKEEAAPTAEEIQLSTVETA